MPIRRIDAVVTSPLCGGMAPFDLGDAQVALQLWQPGRGLDLAGEALFVFIDWTLPGLAGLELCRRLRCDPQTAQAYIAMVLDSSAAENRARAIGAGADDCIAAPLDRDALAERIRSVRAIARDEVRARIAAFGDLSIDRAAFQARWRGKPLSLMPNEFRLLNFLVEHPGRIFTRAQLIAALGKQEPPLDERTVDVWIGRLRRALRSAGADRMLRTVRSMGYILDLP